MSRAGPDTAVATVDTSLVVAGFGGGHCAGRPPSPRTATPAALR